MELWCAYKSDQSKSDPTSMSYSGASHIQVGSYEASRRDVSVTATEEMASTDTHEVEVLNIGDVSLEYIIIKQS